ncbi:hypothetical protein [Methylopila sp. M107]|uniref:hypothetical protein n=1 Tax=Methylopila sp. M107 TaxID=1101190 RepID=UPI00037CFABD|nr:hypothetical protein [Methylopila sp. M107]
MRPAAVLGRALALGCLAAASLAVTPIISEESARKAAIKVLLEPPYGLTAEESARALSPGRFVEARDKPLCAENGVGAWTFSVATRLRGRPVDGVIQIAASGGVLDCTNLPSQD